MKAVSIFLFLMIHFHSFTQSISYDFYANETGDYMNQSGCGQPSVCLFGPNFSTIGPFKIRGTHGCITDQRIFTGQKGLKFNTRNQNNGTWKRGDGMLIAYNFKKGHTYTNCVHCLFL